METKDISNLRQFKNCWEDEHNRRYKECICFFLCRVPHNSEQGKECNSIVTVSVVFLVL